MMRMRHAAGLALALCVLGSPSVSTAQQPAAAPPAPAATPASAPIHQEIDFPVDPRRVYEALLDDKQFSAFSGRAATIGRELGGASSLFGGHIIARNVELVPNRRIVQAWRVVTWPEGVWSIARFDLQANGAGAHLIFEHAGFPPELRDHLAEGWEINYWSLLKKYLHS